MGRKSKYEALTNEVMGTKWSAAVYLRLSREDGDRAESDSISNQKSLLNEFISHEPDVDIVDYYIDDGWSGTTFERPEFMRMMGDIKTRLVNCIIVKDLSRFGRNYIDTGNYIEKVFPMMDVRFISVNDQLDSHKAPDSMNNLIVPFKNIINDEYCRDISNKIRSSLDMKRKQGKHIGSFALYGYKKDAKDKNQLVIDENAAEIVRYIYEEFLSGVGCLGIAKKLNARGIPNPAEYKKQQGINYKHPAASTLPTLWCDSSIRRILRNRMYTGCMVQGIHKVKSYKVPISVAQPEDKWYVVPGTHEAIIEPKMFEQVQSMFQRDTRTAPDKQKVYLFSGFLRCADCGRGMNRKLISQPKKTYNYFICNTYKKKSQDACTKHTIRSDKLEEAVFATIQQQIKLAVSMDDVLQMMKENSRHDFQARRLEKTLRQLENEHNKIEEIKLSLYPDWKAGDITKDEYVSLKAKQTLRQSEIKENIKKIEEDMQGFEQGAGSGNDFLQTFIKHNEITKLTREILMELVEYIYIHEGGGITIQFKFADEYKKMTEYVEETAEQQDLQAEVFTNKPAAMPLPTPQNL